LGAVQNGQIVKFLQIQFILYSSFRKGSIWVTLTELHVASDAAASYRETDPPGL
jgi:hypothetical protein